MWLAGALNDALKHRVLAHDGYLDAAGLAAAVATCTHWRSMTVRAAAFAATLHSMLLEKFNSVFVVERAARLPAEARHELVRLMAPKVLEAWKKLDRPDVEVEWRERDPNEAMPERIRLPFGIVGALCRDHDENAAGAATAAVLRDLTARAVAVHEWCSVDACVEVELYYGTSARPHAAFEIIRGIAELAFYAAPHAVTLFDCAFAHSSPRGNSDEYMLDHDDKALLSRLAPWVPADQLATILGVVLEPSHFPGGKCPDEFSQLLGRVLGRRAHLVPAELARRMIDALAASDSDSAVLQRWERRNLWNHGRATDDGARERILIAAGEMGAVDMRASCRLFLPLLDDATTRVKALGAIWCVMYPTHRDYTSLTSTRRGAAGPIVTPDEFLRLAGYLETPDDRVFGMLVHVLAGIAHAGGDELSPAVETCTPLVLDALQNREGKESKAACIAFLAESAIAGVAGAADALAATPLRRRSGEAMRRVAKATRTGSSDDVLVGALRARLRTDIESRLDDDRDVIKSEWTPDLKALAAFGPRAAAALPELMDLLLGTEWSACGLDDLLEALVSFGPDAYRPHAAAVAEWARRSIKDRDDDEYGEDDDDDVTEFVRRIVESLGADGVSHAWLLVYLSRYKANVRGAFSQIDGLGFLDREKLLSRCRTLRLVGEFGARCPDDAVSALLDHVLYDNYESLGRLSIYDYESPRRFSDGNPPDPRLDAFVFATLKRLGPTCLARHEQRIVSNLERLGSDDDSKVGAPGAIALLASLPGAATHVSLFATLVEREIQSYLCIEERVANESDEWRLEGSEVAFDCEYAEDQPVICACIDAFATLGLVNRDTVIKLLTFPVPAVRRAAAQALRGAPLGATLAARRDAALEFNSARWESLLERRQARIAEVEAHAAVELGLVPAVDGGLEPLRRKDRYRRDEFFL